MALDDMPAVFPSSNYTVVPPAVPPSLITGFPGLPPDPDQPTV